MAAYHRPETLREALELLASERLTVAAGCTDLYPATQARALPGPVLDIAGIAALSGIVRGPEGWRIGAATTWTGVLRADLPPAFDGLKLAACEIGSVQIQNAGTVAGNLCTASPAGDSIPCLMTLDARVELRSVRGQRLVPLAEFLTGARQTALAPDELVTAVLVPEGAARGRSTFAKLGARKYLVISIAMVAARLVIADGRIAEAAVAVGACSPVAVRLTALEAALAGQPVEAAAGLAGDALVAPALSPIDDIRADAGYRAQAAAELVRRALAALAPGREAAA